MRRYSVVEKPRAELVADLDERIRYHEHVNPDRPERAESYQIARLELVGGVMETYAHHTLFRVAEFASASYGVTEGTRTELAAELDRYGDDRWQNGKEEKARQFARALHAIRDGHDEVRVGDTVYRVIEG